MKIRIQDNEDGTYSLLGIDNNGVEVLAEPGQRYDSYEDAQDAVEVWHETMSEEA